MMRSHTTEEGEDFEPVNGYVVAKAIPHVGRRKAVGNPVRLSETPTTTPLRSGKGCCDGPAQRFCGGDTD